MNAHPPFRSAIVGGNTVRQYNDVHLGVAVSLPGDELTIAALAGADGHGFNAFALALQDSIDRARAGETSTCPVQLTISNMAPYGIRSAQPVVMPPAAATLFVGSPFSACRPGADGSIQWIRAARLVLAFDHRLMNGVGAARFLREVKQRIEGLPETRLIPEPEVAAIEVTHLGQTP
jgi:pyruvate/2-oxoglutarate dehydrogenase complex dihydrolipoamide acyltransferase (E2) component